MRLHGYEAIEYAKTKGVLLNKYTDPVEPEPGELNLSIEEAEEICKENGNLIYIDTDD